MSLKNSVLNNKKLDNLSSPNSPDILCSACLSGCLFRYSLLSDL